MTERPKPTQPSPNPDAVRRAYLDLLKLALCDLVAPSTDGVYTRNGVPVSKRLTEDRIAERIEGLDWPLRGLTMIGYSRLADLQGCIEEVVADGVAGDFIEAGVWRGGASMLARATLDTLGEFDRTVWLADSFEGLPAPDEGFPEDSGNDFFAHDYFAVEQAEVRTTFERLNLLHSVEFVEGFFSDTLPALAGNRWAVIRLDGDMYEATWITLESLYPDLAQGGYVIFDDYGTVKEGRRAMDDFRASRGIDTPLEWADHACVRWRREEPPDLEPVGPSARTRVSEPGLARPDIVVKTEHEVVLEEQKANFEAHVASLEANADSMARYVEQLEEQLRAAGTSMFTRARAKVRRDVDRG